MRIKFSQLLLLLTTSFGFSTVFGSTLSSEIHINSNGYCSVRFTSGEYFSTSTGRHNIRISSSGEINANCKWDAPAGTPSGPLFEQIGACWVDGIPVSYNDATVASNNKVKVNCHSSD